MQEIDANHVTVFEFGHDILSIVAQAPLLRWHYATGLAGFIPSLEINHGCDFKLF